MPARFKLPRFYPILDTAFLERGQCDVLTTAQILLEAGVGILQYRHKDAWRQVHYDEAHGIGELCRRTGALFIVNDRADFAQLLSAGLHVGQDDLPPVAARMVAPNAVLGFSTHNGLQLRRANEEPADYVSLGPIFPTTSKERPDPTVGIDGLKALRAVTAKPLVAIGGITLENARQVLDAEADSVAVISGILPESGDAESIQRTTSRWLEVTA